MKHLQICKTCKAYTLQNVCNQCKGKTFLAQPAKFKPDDKYAKYRRVLKEKEWKKEGLV